MRQPLILDSTFHDILNELEKSRDHFFITGKAGTGKSTLLQLFRKTTHKKTVVLSPTGISALNVQGQTIHSFFQFPPQLLQKQDIHLNRRLMRLLSALEVLVIDEISMVRADLLDAVNWSLQLHRKVSLPFGGVQVVFFGDLFQLPPVLSTKEEKTYFQTIYPGPYFFDSDIIRNGITLQMVELTKVYRQSERHFIRLLDELRTQRMDYDGLVAFNERYIPDAQIEEPYLTLCSTNAAANKINADRLWSLEGPSLYYQGSVQGDFSSRLFPTELQLELRRHAQVMLIRNDPEKKFVNGTLATVTGLTEQEVHVKIDSGSGDQEILSLPRMTWEILRYSYAGDERASIQTEIIGSFTQYPVRLAWAVTIHKSQGQTYDRVLIDFGRGAFEHGQAYVALSRCRTLGGLYLKKPLSYRDIIVDERIAEYYAMMRS